MQPCLFIRLWLNCVRMRTKTGTKPERPAAGRIRGVVFDVDGTLYDQSLLRIILAVRLVGALIAHPIRTSRDIKIVSHYRKHQEALRGQRLTVKGLRRKQAAMTAASAGSDLHTVEKTVAAWMENIPCRSMALCRRPGLTDVFQVLKQNGYRLGILSDYPSEGKLQALGVRSFVDAVLCTSDPAVGNFKPHPRGFRAIARRMGLPTGRILYVGDRSDVDAAGALSAGMKTVLVRSGIPWHRGGGIPRCAIRRIPDYVEGIR